jgi:hypothetical protein
MYFRAFLLIIVFVLNSSVSVAETCAAFKNSTVETGTGVPESWRTDYPELPLIAPQPWSKIDFRTDPNGYMNAVLDGARISFHIENHELVGNGQEPWWISDWLDYTTSGRERLMGLTKERGLNAGDLSPTSGEGYQVWAVGFYNSYGAAILRDIFAEPCNPSLPVSISFPENTVSIKFLFTDADPSEVKYLQNAPELDAMIDAAGSGSSGKPVNQRTKRTVRLLQVDISVKDNRSSSTGWIFGTYAWVGPPKGDLFFDNLVPVALQWGNDPAIYDGNLQETWTNPTLKNVTYGWTARPYMGFFGRANGPADNIRSSCISCHAAARTPRADIGILGSSFNMAYDITIPAKVKAHVDTWFQNIKSGQLFQPTKPAVSALDYSLQLEAATQRICRACATGDLSGPTPNLCRSTGFFNQPTCSIQMGTSALRESLENNAPPRQ